MQIMHMVYISLQKKMEFRDCDMGWLLIFLDYKANSLICVSLNIKKSKQVLCILVECCETPSLGYPTF